MTGPRLAELDRRAAVRAAGSVSLAGRRACRVIDQHLDRDDADTKPSYYPGN